MGSVFPLANAANPHSSIAMAFFRAATEQALWRTPSFNARVGLTFGGVFLLLPLSLPRRVTDHVVTKTGEAANFARKAHGRFWQPAMLGTLLGRSSSSRLSAANCTLDVDRYDIKAPSPHFNCHLQRATRAATQIVPLPPCGEVQSAVSMSWCYDGYLCTPSAS